jgi:hypothetical protein
VSHHEGREDHEEIKDGNSLDALFNFVRFVFFVVKVLPLLTSSQPAASP